MTNLHIVAKCNFCKETIKFEKEDILYFDLASDDNTERIFHKCENCGKENYFELLLRQRSKDEC